MSASAIHPNSHPSEVASSLPDAFNPGHKQACRHSVISSRYGMLDEVLPNGGWPRSALIELLIQRPGIGEMRLLRPALDVVARNRSIILIQPPQLPQSAAGGDWDLPPERVLRIKTRRGADALSRAEQILRDGNCGALVLWQSHVRTEALCRLHMAARESDTLFWMLRPLASVRDSSPAQLRLGLRAAQAGISINVVKRRGPQHDDAIYLPLGTGNAAPALDQPQQRAA